MYKEKKYLIKKLWIPYMQPTPHQFLDIKNLATIKLGCKRRRNHLSNHTFTDGTTQTVKVKGYFTQPIVVEYNNAFISNLNPSIFGKSDNDFFIGQNNYFDTSTTRIITKIKVECVSNVNSDILNHEIYLKESTTKPPSQEGCTTVIDAFRTNPGGFAGFNMAILEFQKIRKMQDINGHPRLFKQGTFYHSEIPYEQSNMALKIKKKHDILLIPHFDWQHSQNATYILSNGKQVVTVSKPYCEFNVNVEYYEL